MNCKLNLQGLQDKYDSLRQEQDAVAQGHNNKKQKIHYINVLKQQINELIEENRRLRGNISSSSSSSG